MTEEVKDEQIKDETKETDVEKETKVLSEEEFEKKLQSETDKRVSQAIKTAKENWEKEYQEKLESEKSEAAKLASMTESERAQAEIQKEREAFEAERKQFQRERMELQTVKELSAEGLPTSFSGYVIADTAEDVKKNIADFKSAWQTALEDAVNERLKGKTPSNSSTKVVSMTKEEFNKLGYAERAKLIETDPELYQELKNR